MHDVITFDCYGTLIDWERGFTDAFVREGLTDERERVIDLYHAVEPEIESETWMPYREVLREVALRVSANLGRAIDPARASFLPDSLPSWPVFPDTNAALERLAGAGIRLGILSNVDDDLFARTAEQFAVKFDLVITAAQVRSYKPAHAHFIEARRRIGDARWLHAAQSHFHDVVPARALGIEVAWVNRKHEQPARAILPDHEVPDMAELAALLLD
jgi:2-haloalkanoic acid dehalogenase type II